jgi:hypothetical protein
MSGLWKLITNSHHPIVVAALILVLGVFVVHATLDAVAFALRIVNVAIDELAKRVDDVKESAGEAAGAARRLYERMATPRPTRRGATLPHDGEG